MNPNSSCSHFYVLCPAEQKTGGPEALHQLVAQLSLLNIPSSIAYFDKYGKVVDAKTPDTYAVYNVNVAREIDDSVNNVILLPETATYLLWQYKTAHRIVWWLSVDNFFVARGGALRRMMRRILRGHKDFDFKGHPRLSHVAQSYYAKQTLEQLGLSDVALLTDYLRDEFIEKSSDRPSEKQNIVVYNPKKGINFTEMLMNASDKLEFRWVPLINLKPEEVVELLKKAKVYVDFGEHPGRDRIPREAALCGCVVITGMKGSAKNSVDVPIPQEYKFNDETASHVDAIVDLITQVMLSFEQHSTRFESYRHWIVDNKKMFIEEAKIMVDSLV
jgi:hypothetical protein